MVTLYRLMELVDGERGIKIIPYRYAQRIKVWCLMYIK